MFGKIHKYIASIKKSPQLPILNMKTCVAFICDLAYFPKFKYTYYLLRSVGKYDGDVCLVVFEELYHSELLAEFCANNPAVIVQWFHPILFPQSFHDSQISLNREKYWNDKMFQFNKLYLFHAYFKHWDYVLYLDCGITIYREVAPLLACAAPNTLYAHSNEYPYYTKTLKCQFDQTISLFRELETTYNLEIDYPQTTIMLYDTSIIQETTVLELYQLAVKYPISMTNDQGIVALYFTNVRPLWKQLPLGDETQFYYDYLARRGEKFLKPYIMVKVNHIVDNGGVIEEI